MAWGEWWRDQAAYLLGSSVTNEYFHVVKSGQVSMGWTPSVASKRE